MIGNSAFDFYFIKTCIIGLHYLAPLCILYCVFVVAVYGLKATRYPVPLVIETVAVAESLFFLLVYIPYRRHLQREAIHPPALAKVDRKELFELCNENIPDHEAYLRKWFLGAELKDIKEDNVKEFLLWAFFNRGGPPGDDDEELNEYVKATEEHLGVKIEPGRGKAKCLRLTLDKVDMLHRSLIWYICVGFVDFLTYMTLLFHGFTFYRSPLSQFFTLFPFRPQVLFAKNKSPTKHLTYWYRPHTSKTKMPILFAHGIGIGLYPYTHFLSELNSQAGLESSDPNDQVGIIALEIMPVSFRITHDALEKDELCAEIASILRHHGWDKVVLVSHSYGTVVSTHLMKNPTTSKMIGPIVLIDPVSILLHLPDVAYNFTRRQPQKANEHQLYYFASMDMSVSHTLSRHFFWSENVIWKKDLKGHNITVSLSGQDLIVDTEAVGTYMANKDISLTPQSQTQSQSSDSSGILIELQDEASQDPDGKAIKPIIDSENRAGDDSDGNVEEWKQRPWKGHGIDVLWFENLDHAQVFDKAATRRPLITAIRTYCGQGE